jgi:hypothetical protein
MGTAKVQASRPTFIRRWLVSAIGCAVLLTPSSRAIAGPEHNVTFMAEISTWDDPLGHIWVRFGDGHDQVFGFYPAGDSKKAMFRLAGEVSDDSYRRADVSYTFKVTDAEFAKGRAVIETYRTKSYVFPIANCKSMVAGIARAIGLKTPSGFMQSPAEYLGNLVDAN